MLAPAMWWRDAVVYQVYPRSFQDSDGDGVGDLRGIAERLEHLAYLGVDALWLSPIYPSPLADFGYDVSDYTDVDPRFGTLSELDALIASARGLGLRVLLDFVLCHTSIEHPWFREHPDRYIWSPVDGPPNNWLSAFGGPAWSRDQRSGRWYLHSFYPEQADLDWRNPDVVRALQDVVRFWLGRGVDGFRLDAIDRLGKDEQLRDDPPATGSFPFPRHPEAAPLEMRYSGNGPLALEAIRALREAAGDALLVGELYRPADEYTRWLEVLDLVFAFEFMFSPWEAGRLRAAIEPAARAERAAWVLSNHDFERLASHVGAENVREAAVLLLTLPGAAFVYQGDEIGLVNGPGIDPPLDRAGRDRLRHPMQWDATGGFTTGTPWLPLVDPEQRSVEAQRGDPGSLLELYRRLLELRRELGTGFRLLEGEPGVVVFERGGHTVAVNTTREPRTAPSGELVLATADGKGLPANAAMIVRN
jgi:alpha-glucosidase